MFSLRHLWFRYYLLWLYALLFGLRWLLTRSEPVSRNLRAFADGVVQRAMLSAWSPVWLAMGTGLLLWLMDEWFGVETHVVSLIPSPPVLLAYGAFFAFDWLLHRRAELLSAHEGSRVVIL